MNKSLIFLLAFLCTGFSQLSISITATPANVYQTTTISGMFLDNGTPISSANILVGIENISSKIILSNPDGTYSTTFQIPELRTAVYNVSVIGIYQSSSISNSTNISIAGETNLELNFTPTKYTALNITKTMGDSFNILANAKNIGINKANSVLLSILFMNNTQAFSCGTVTSVCSNTIPINIPENTKPGNYSLKLNLSWVNDDSISKSIQKDILVEVLPNTRISISPTALNLSMGLGETRQVTFTLLPAGNTDPVISFDLAGLLPPSYFTFPTSFVLNSSTDVNITISIPSNDTARNITGSIKILDQFILVNLTLISPKLEWSMSEINYNITNETYAEFPLKLKGYDFPAYNVSYFFSCPTGWICKASRDLTDIILVGEEKDITVSVNMSWIETVIQKEVIFYANDSGRLYRVNINFKALFSGPDISNTTIIYFANDFKAEDYYFISNGTILQTSMFDLNNLYPRIRRGSAASIWTAQLILNDSEGIDKICVPKIRLEGENFSNEPDWASGSTVPLLYGAVGQPVYEYYILKAPGICKVHFKINEEDLYTYIVVSGLVTQTVELTKDDIMNLKNETKDILDKRLQENNDNQTILVISIFTAFIFISLLRRMKEKGMILRAESFPKEVPK